VFLETTFCETVQGKGMGRYKRKTAKVSIYSRKKMEDAKRRLTSGDLRRPVPKSL
jgi:hypothetical protein